MVGEITDKEEAPGSNSRLFVFARSLSLHLVVSNVFTNRVLLSRTVHERETCGMEYYIDEVSRKWPNWKEFQNIQNLKRSDKQMIQKFDFQVFCVKGVFIKYQEKSPS